MGCFIMLLAVCDASVSTHTPPPPLLHHSLLRVSDYVIANRHRHLLKVLEIKVMLYEWPNLIVLTANPPVNPMQTMCGKTQEVQDKDCKGLSASATECASGQASYSVSPHCFSLHKPVKYTASFQLGLSAVLECIGRRFGCVTLCTRALSISCVRVNTRLIDFLLRIGLSAVYWSQAIVL